MKFARRHAICAGGVVVEHKRCMSPRRDEAMGVVRGRMREVVDATEPICVTALFPTAPTHTHRGAVVKREGSSAAWWLRDVHRWESLRARCEVRDTAIGAVVEREGGHPSWWLRHARHALGEDHPSGWSGGLTTRKT